jgi:hypothetical protein
MSFWILDFGFWIDKVLQNLKSNRPISIFDFRLQSRSKIKDATVVSGIDFRFGLSKVNPKSKI